MRDRDGNESSESLQEEAQQPHAFHETGIRGSIDFGVFFSKIFPHEIFFIVLKCIWHKLYHLIVLSVQFSSTKYIHTVMHPGPLSISRTSSFSQNETLSPRNTHPPMRLPQPGYHHLSTSCLYESDYVLKSVESHRTCPFVTG